MEKLNFNVEIIEMPQGIFTAQIKNVCGAIVQEESRDSAIEEVFKQAWLCLKVDSANLIS